MKIITAGILGGIILFIWSAISWMALPWHMATIHSFKDETAVAQIIQANTPTSGIYLMPSMPKNGAAKDSAQLPTSLKAPMVFASVNLAGMRASMTVPMIISLITQIVAAFFVAWLLLQARNSSYFGRVGFVMVFALATAIVSLVPCWNWFGFDVNYTLVLAADLLIGWFLAGLVMAAICKN